MFEVFRQYIIESSRAQITVNTVTLMTCTLFCTVLGYLMAAVTFWFVVLLPPALLLIFLAARLIYVVGLNTGRAVTHDQAQQEIERYSQPIEKIESAFKSIFRRDNGSIASDHVHTEQ